MVRSHLESASSLSRFKRIEVPSIAQHTERGVRMREAQKSGTLVQRLQLHVGVLVYRSPWLPWRRIIAERVLLPGPTAATDGQPHPGPSMHLSGLLPLLSIVEHGAQHRRSINMVKFHCTSKLIKAAKVPHVASRIFSSDPVWKHSTAQLGRKPHHGNTWWLPRGPDNDLKGLMLASMAHRTMS